MNMKLIRYTRPDLWSASPFEQMNTLRDEINRLFEMPFGELSRPGEFFTGWAPALDLREELGVAGAALELVEVAFVLERRQELDVAGARVALRRARRGTAATGHGACDDRAAHKNPPPRHGFGSPAHLAKGSGSSEGSVPSVT